jgi:hypothetical protein
VIAGVILWFIGRRFWLPTPREAKLRQLTINSSENPVTSGTISPDGKYLAYTDLKGMHVKLVGSDAAQTLSTPEELKNSQVSWDVGFNGWFPGGDRFLANARPATETGWSSQTSSIWTFPVAGGKPRKLRDRAIAWSMSPDGTSIFLGTNKGKFGERELGNGLEWGAGSQVVCGGRENGALLPKLGARARALRIYFNRRYRRHDAEQRFQRPAHDFISAVRHEEDE